MEPTYKADCIILHAGLPKTATTSIQNACFSQKDALLSQHDILFPGDEPNHTNALCTAFLNDPRNHISNKMAGFTDLDALRARGDEIRQSIEDSIARYQPGTVLFSAEGMSNLAAEELARFRDWALTIGHELKVFYILRNPLNYTTSVMQQHIKGGEVLEDMYENPPLPNAKGRISAAIQAFGRENVSAHVFEELVAGKDGIVGAFLDIIGVSSGPVRASILSKRFFDNESLSHEAALILSSLNRQRPAFVDGKIGPMRTLNELQTIAGIRGDKFRLPPEVAQKVLNATRPDVDWIRETFAITAYDKLGPSGGQTAASALPKSSIDSVALIISNLINDRQINALINRARTLHHSGRQDEIGEIRDTALRISPNRTLPGFMSPANAGSSD